MVFSRRVRDSGLIDALEEGEAESFDGSVWRVVRDGRDPRHCGSSGGRWDDRTFDVLYTALERDGTIAEMYFHLSRGQPVFPSKIRYRIFELSISLSRLLRLSTLDDLEKIGLDVATYGQLSYIDRQHEYPRSQDIAETAQFLDFDGILVPNARWNCANIVVFCDHIESSAIQVTKDHGLIAWPAWRRDNIGSAN